MPSHLVRQVCIVSVVVNFAKVFCSEEAVKANGTTDSGELGEEKKEREKRVGAWRWEKHCEQERRRFTRVSRCQCNRFGFNLDGTLFSAGFFNSDSNVENFRYDVDGNVNDEEDKEEKGI